MKTSTTYKNIHATFDLSHPRFKGMNEKDARKLYVIELMLNNPHLKQQWFNGSQLRVH